jgi:Tfp pilus assembly protein PilO
MNTLEELQNKIKELEERLALLEKKSPNKKIITDYSSTMVKDYILADKLSKKKGGEF